MQRFLWQWCARKQPLVTLIKPSLFFLHPPSHSIKCMHSLSNYKQETRQAIREMQTCLKDIQQRLSCCITIEEERSVLRELQMLIGHMSRVPFIMEVQLIEETLYYLISKGHVALVTPLHNELIKIVKQDVFIPDRVESLLTVVAFLRRGKQDKLKILSDNNDKLRQALLLDTSVDRVLLYKCVLQRGLFTLYDLNPGLFQLAIKKCMLNAKEFDHVRLSLWMIFIEKEAYSALFEYHYDQQCMMKDIWSLIELYHLPQYHVKRDALFKAWCRYLADKGEATWEYRFKYILQLVSEKNYRQAHRIFKYHADHPLPENDVFFDQKHYSSFIEFLYNCPLITKKEALDMCCFLLKHHYSWLSCGLDALDHHVIIRLLSKISEPSRHTLEQHIQHHRLESIPSTASVPTVRENVSTFISCLLELDSFLQDTRTALSVFDHLIQAHFFEQARDLYSALVTHEPDIESRLWHRVESFLKQCLSKHQYHRITLVYDHFVQRIHKNKGVTESHVTCFKALIYQGQVMKACREYQHVSKESMDTCFILTRLFTASELDDMMADCIVEDMDALVSSLITTPQGTSFLVFLSKYRVSIPVVSLMKHAHWLYQHEHYTQMVDLFEAFSCHPVYCTCLFPLYLMSLIQLGQLDQFLTLHHVFTVKHPSWQASLVPYLNSISSPLQREFLLKHAAQLGLDG